MKIGRLTSRIESVAMLSFLLVVSLWTALLRGSWISNVPLLLRDSAWLGMVAIGQALLIISGEFDLSVGSVFAFVSVVFVWLMRIGVGAVPSFLTAMLVSGLIGFVNGTITLRFRVPSLIVTLGTLFILRGLIYFVSQGFSIGIPDEAARAALSRLLGGEFLGLNNAVILFALLILSGTIMLGKTRFGNHVRAVGADARSALSCGVSPIRVKGICFIVCSAMAGLSGLTAASYFRSVAPTQGEGMEFETVAAAVIGGCSLRGGIGSIWGTMLGACTLIAIRSGLVMMGVNIFLYQILLGVLLVVVIAVKEPLSRVA
jgi:simple sugar transport system permease protein